MRHWHPGFEARPKRKMTMNEVMRDRRDVDTMRRGDGGEEAREEGAVSG